MPVATAPNVRQDDLVTLFRGDADSTGYASPLLVDRLCRQLRPGCADDIRKRIYPGVVMSELNAVAQDAICRGYTLWLRAGKPTS